MQASRPSERPDVQKFRICIGSFNLSFPVLSFRPSCPPCHEQAATSNDGPKKSQLSTMRLSVRRRKMDIFFLECTFEFHTSCISHVFRPTAQKTHGKKRILITAVAWDHTASQPNRGHPCCQSQQKRPSVNFNLSSLFSTPSVAIRTIRGNQKYRNNLRDWLFIQLSFWRLAVWSFFLIPRRPT